MNSTHRPTSAVILVSCMPLLLLATTWMHAAWLSAITATSFAGLAALDKLISKVGGSAFSEIASLALLSGLISLFDLLVQAFAWPSFLAIRSYLPLIACSAFSVLVVTRDYRWPNQSPIRNWLLPIGIGILAMVGIGFARGSIDGNSMLQVTPATILILTGCILAAINWVIHRRENDSNNSKRDEIPGNKTRRVRVTGPVS